MILFYLLATVLATACAFWDTLGITEIVSTAFLVCACLSEGKTKTSKIFTTLFSSVLIALSLVVAIFNFTKGASHLLLPSTWLAISQALFPFITASTIMICLIRKKDPVTIATFAIAVTSIFTLASNCLSIFITYNKFTFDAIKLFINDLSNEFIKLIESQDVGNLAQKVYVSFMTRMSISLIPGIFIALSVIQVFAILLIIKLILKNKLDAYHKGPWAISFSTISAIINIFCIIAFMSCFFSSSVTTFSAVAGNIMLVLTPASAVMGLAFIIIGYKKGGILNIILCSLPLLMLFIMPPVAIIYISFIGSANVIFSRIALAMMNVK